MRTAFVEALCAAAEDNQRIWLLTGDLGYTVLEKFASRFPDRFVNAGVAEQNMTGVAAGLALTGKIVFTYSIANFPTLRCLEHIRNDVCYHAADVKIVAVGGGLAYGQQGYTHHAVEDLAVMRALPNMTVLAPGDPVEARLREQVEICVSDNASSDGTDTVMRAYAERPDLRVVYHRNPRDLGAHANVLRVFELAHGDYVWFLGSDDALAEGAVVTVLGLLAEHPGLAGLTVNRENFDLAMRPGAGDDPPDLHPERSASPHDYGSFEEILAQCGLFHTYGSSQIVDRALWLRTVERLGPEASGRFANYPHAYVIGQMVRERPRWAWCPDRLVKKSLR